MKTENFILASATDTAFFNTLIRVIRYDEGSGTGTPKIRIRSLKTGAVDVEMIPGRMLRLPEAVDGIVITNLTGSAITGKLTMGAGDVTDNSLVGTVTLDAATLAALEIIDLNPATINQLMLKNTGSSAVNTPAAGAGATALVLPADNTKGLWVTEAMIFTYNSGAATAVALLAKNAAPGNTADGELILHAGASSGVTGSARLEKQVFVAAGLGLYYYNSVVESAHAGIMRAARWKLL